MLNYGIDRSASFGGWILIIIAIVKLVSMYWVIKWTITLDAHSKLKGETFAKIGRFVMYPILVGCIILARIPKIRMPLQILQCEWISTIWIIGACIGWLLLKLIYFEVESKDYGGK